MTQAAAVRTRTREAESLVASGYDPVETRDGGSRFGESRPFAEGSSASFVNQATHPIQEERFRNDGCISGIARTDASFPNRPS